MKKHRELGRVRQEERNWSFLERRVSRVPCPLMNGLEAWDTRLTQ